ncbi:MAG: hypothetical protein ACR2KL_05805 [Nocardioidaceae bacterium]
MATDDRDALAADLLATVAARQELEPAYEPALVESFLDRMEEQVDKRVAAELEQRERQAKEQEFDTGLVYASLGIGIPLTAIAGGVADLPGIGIAWAGIVAVNVAAAWGSRRRRR